MALALYRRHRRDCKAGHSEELRSSEYDEKKKGWKRCECPIFISGTLLGTFKRQSTSRWEWDQALSFAKNSSADMSLRHNAFITVMQAAELRDLDDPSRTRNSTRKWTLLVESQMSPRSVVVSEIRSQGSFEMLRV